MLSNNDINKAIENRSLILSPYTEEQIQPASIDLRLDGTLLIPGSDTKVTIQDDTPFLLNPQEFILGSTLELVGLDNTLGALVAGKSSLARQGLTVATGFVDPGFKGTITLEIFNVSNKTVPLTRHMGIAQLVLHKLDTPGTKYNGKYQNQRGATPARSIQEWI